ncbi:hypothetical protein [Halobaculum lipolyticum]|uniref:DUF8215 domain-containing protein n=1 Tax=Halobaculum lipolyticum TaxID=3032001 RepID=A0ABD5W756_9EURY|nr:hypothetical protein [Halobaculum sp. DT31]
MSDGRDGVERAATRRAERHGNDSLGRFLEDVFDTFIEHGLVAFPGLLVAIRAVPRDASVPLVFGYVALLSGLALVRHDRLRRRADRFAPWPRGLASGLWVRVVYYNAAVLAVAGLAVLGSAVGGGLETVLAALTVAFAFVVGLAFPHAFAAAPVAGPDPDDRYRDVYALRADRRRRER